MNLGSSYEVVLDRESNQTTIERMVWVTRDGRWIGDEYVIESWWTIASLGLRDGRDKHETFAFATKTDAVGWVDELHERHHIWLAAGGRSV